MDVTDDQPTAFGGVSAGELDRLVRNFARIFGVAPTFQNVLEFSDYVIELNRAGQLPHPFPEQTGVIRSRH